IELHRQAIFTGRHQIGFQRAQRPLVRLAILIAELVPASPPPGADHVQSRIMDLSEILIPYVNVGMLEKRSLHFARHVCRAHYRQRMTVKFKVIVIDTQTWPGSKVRFVTNPESRMINRTHSLALQQLRLDDEESLVWRRRKYDWYRRRERPSRGCAIRGVRFWKARDLHREPACRLRCAPVDL